MTTTDTVSRTKRGWMTTAEAARFVGLSRQGFLNHAPGRVTSVSEGVFTFWRTSELRAKKREIVAASRELHDETRRENAVKARAKKAAKHGRPAPEVTPAPVAQPVPDVFASLATRPRLVGRMLVAASTMDLDDLDTVVDMMERMRRGEG